MTKADLAIKVKEKGFACSQAVISVFAEQFGLDVKAAQKISCGFGGGIGGQGMSCGAVTGAVMALGLRFGMGDESEPEKKPLTYEKTTEFMKMFREKNKTIICNELLGYDISNAEDREIIKQKNLSKTVCNEVIRDAVEIVEKMLAE